MYINTTTQEAEAGESQVQEQPRQDSKTHSSKRETGRQYAVTFLHPSV